MFKQVTQSVVHQMDPKGDLVPVHGIFSHEHFRPLCLLTRKREAIFFTSPRYKPSRYRLDDVLLSGEDNKSTESLFPNGGGEASSKFTVMITSNTIGRGDGSLSVSVDPASIDVKGAASLSRGWSIKLDKKYIPLPKLEALKTVRKINVNHSFIQQLKKTQENLYLVHEIIETLEETSCEESTMAQGSFMAQIYTKFHAKGTREDKQSITIPKGCTLAFRAIQLDIRDALWDFNHFKLRQMTETISYGSSRGRLGEVEKEVKENCQILSNLSSKLFVAVLKAIKAVMRDRNLFQELTQKMEAVLDETGSCELKTESPDLKDLLSSLQDSSPLVLKLAEAITYTLDALDELKEDQLLLLLESLEEKIVSQQLKLVGNILEHDIERGKGPFSMDTTLLSFSREEQQKLTFAMVEMSGVKLQKDGSAVCTGNAFPATAALYTSLYVLNLLSNSG
ncbi:gasdermin-A-like [Pelecanus crispus]|uniref:gasdermin-A-like n=1 Tax=Pelecanus crispus TaxID=36300 RepID=UPI003F5D1A6B